MARQVSERVKNTKRYQETKRRVEAANARRAKSRASSSSSSSSSTTTTARRSSSGGSSGSSSRSSSGTIVITGGTKEQQQQIADDITSGKRKAPASGEIRISDKKPIKQRIRESEARSAAQQKVIRGTASAGDVLTAQEDYDPQTGIPLTADAQERLRAGAARTKLKQEAEAYVGATFRDVDTAVSEANRVSRERTLRRAAETGPELSSPVAIDRRKQVEKDVARAARGITITDTKKDDNLFSRAGDTLTYVSKSARGDISEQEQRQNVYKIYQTVKGGQEFFSPITDIGRSVGVTGKRAVELQLDVAQDIGVPTKPVREAFRLDAPSKPEQKIKDLAFSSEGITTGVAAASIAVPTIGFGVGTYFGVQSGINAAAEFKATGGVTARTAGELTFSVLGAKSQFRAARSQVKQIVDPVLDRTLESRPFFIEKVGVSQEAKGASVDFVARYKGETLSRQGKEFGVRRVKAPSFKRPVGTVVDFVQGRKPGQIKFFDPIGRDVILRDIESQFATSQTEAPLGGQTSILASSTADAAFLAKAAKSDSATFRVIPGGAKALETLSGRPGVGGIELGQFFAPRSAAPIRSVRNEKFFGLIPEKTTVTSEGTPQVYLRYARGNFGDSYIGAILSGKDATVSKGNKGILFKQEQIRRPTQKEFRLSYEEQAQRFAFEPGKTQLSSSTLANVRTELEVISSFQTQTKVRKGQSLSFGGESFDVFLGRDVSLTKTQQKAATKANIDYLSTRIEQVKKLGTKDGVLSSKAQEIIVRDTETINRLQLQLDTRFANIPDEFVSQPTSQRFGVITGKKASTRGGRQARQPQPAKILDVESTQFSRTSNQFSQAQVAKEISLIAGITRSRPTRAQSRVSTSTRTSDSFFRGSSKTSSFTGRSTTVPGFSAGGSSFIGGGSSFIGGGSDFTGGGSSFTGGGGSDFIGGRSFGGSGSSFGGSVTDDFTRNPPRKPRKSTKKRKRQVKVSQPDITKGFTQSFSKGFNFEFERTGKRKRAEQLFAIKSGLALRL